MERVPYATDLSDEQRTLIEPLVTAWKQERVARSATGDPGSCDLREVVNALLHQNRTGCQWRLPPHDLPAWSAVFHSFTLWREDGLDQRVQEILRCQVRERCRRLEDPSLRDSSPNPDATATQNGPNALQGGLSLGKSRWLMRLAAMAVNDQPLLPTCCPGPSRMRGGTSDAPALCGRALPFAARGWYARELGRLRSCRSAARCVPVLLYWTARDREDTPSVI
nr:transposase [Streptomyces taklimakanensis]